MTDARLRAEWLGRMRFDALSDTAWRVFTGALMWSVENGTDGMIPSRYTRYLHPDGEKPDAFAELSAAGIWESTGAGFQMIGWDGELGQSTSAQIEAYKENARGRQRRWREQQRTKLAGKNTQPAIRSSTESREMSDVTRDTTQNVGNGEGEGEGNYAADSATGEFDVDVATGEVSWPVRQPGGPPLGVGLPDPGYCLVCGGPLPCTKSDAKHEAARAA